MPFVDDDPAGGLPGEAPNSQGVASGRLDATSSSIVAGGVVTTLPSAASPPEEALEFAGCMRSHGITDFPDPSSGGGFVFHASAGMTQSPQFQAAQKACQKYMPPGPGSGRPLRTGAGAHAESRGVHASPRHHRLP